MKAWVRVNKARAAFYMPPLSSIAKERIPSRLEIAINFRLEQILNSNF